MQFPALLQDLPPEIQNLIWYIQSENKISLDSHIDIINPRLNEPSLIYSNMSISEPKENEVIKPVSYISKANRRTISVIELDEKQRFLYLQYLQNPYELPKDKGYLFIFYQGLERFLLTEKYIIAVESIKRLRKICKDKIFQSYSLDALVVSALIHSDFELLTNIVKTEDLSAMQLDLYLYVCYKLGIKALYKTNLISLKIFSDTEIENLPLRNVSFFMNTSLRFVDFKIRFISDLLRSRK